MARPKLSRTNRISLYVDDATASLIAELEIRLGVKTSTDVIHRAIAFLADAQGILQEPPEIDRLLAACRKLREAEQEIRDILRAGAVF